MKTEAIISLYLEYCMSRQLRPRTLQAYGQTLGLFALWLREMQGIDAIEDVKETTIRKYILDLQTRGKYTVCADKSTARINYPHHRQDYGQVMSNITINGYLRNIRGLFTWLTEMEYIDRNPMRRIKQLPSQRKAKAYLEDTEIKALVSVMDRESFPEYRDLLAMMLMLDSGTRLGETLSIEMHQIDLIAKTVDLPAEKTKGRKARTVFFSAKTAKELRRYMKVREQLCDSQFLFPVEQTRQPMKVRNYEANFRKYLRRTVITKHVSPHTLRNNFAKRCLMSGMDIYTLSRILGHSSVKVTEKAYLDVADRELREKYQPFSPIESIYRAK